MPTPEYPFPTDIDKAAIAELAEFAKTDSVASPTSADIHVDKIPNKVDLIQGRFQLCEGVKLCNVVNDLHVIVNGRFLDGAPFGRCRLWNCRLVLDKLVQHIDERGASCFGSTCSV